MMSCRRFKNLLHVRPFGIRRSDCIFACGQGYESILQQVHDGFGLTQKAIHMAGRMIVRVGYKQNAVEAERTHGHTIT